MKTLGVIPARGGSKGVPRKNIKPLAGRPLIGWTIDAAAASRLTRTILSTDDEEIAAVGRSLGVDVPFIRPAHLSTDGARSIPVMVHALHACEARDGQTYDAVVMLQPTTPYRTAADIDGALELLERTGADSVISIVDVGGMHPARMKYLEGDRLIDPPFCEAQENQPRQELAPMFIRNGAIYATRRDVLLGGSFKGKDCRGWMMSEARSINIDNAMEWAWAEFVMEKGLL